MGKNALTASCTSSRPSCCAPRRVRVLGNKYVPRTREGLGAHARPSGEDGALTSWLTAGDAKGGSLFSAPQPLPPTLSTAAQISRRPAPAHSFADASTILPHTASFPKSRRLPKGGDRSLAIGAGTSLDGLSGNIRDTTPSGSSSGSRLGSGDQRGMPCCGPERAGRKRVFCPVSGHVGP